MDEKDAGGKVGSVSGRISSQDQENQQVGRKISRWGLARYT